MPLGNKSDPLDELVYIALTVMTEFGVPAVYDSIRTRFSSWDAVLAADEGELVDLLRPIGLYHQRARRIREMLKAIREREGNLDLRGLHRLNDAEAEAYLVTLPGVGKKVARCVMLYSLGRDVFPVDAHVLRVLKRLGLADESLTLQKAQDALQEQIPDILRFTLHVNLVVHGRTVCRARKPRCGECVLAASCPSRIGEA